MIESRYGGFAIAAKGLVVGTQGLLCQEMYQ